MPGSSVMPSSAAEMVGREMPLAAASLRKAASHGSKLPAFLQSLRGGGYFEGSADAAVTSAQRSKAAAASIVGWVERSADPTQVEIALRVGSSLRSTQPAHVSVVCRIATACRSFRELLIEPQACASSIPPLRGPTAPLQRCEPEERLPPSNWHGQLPHQNGPQDGAGQSSNARANARLRDVKRAIVLPFGICALMKASACGCSRFSSTCRTV